jgi:hypothetical protein
MWNNKVKMVMLLLTILFYNLFGSFPKQEKTINVISEVVIPQLDKPYHYLYLVNKDGKNKISSFGFTEPQEVINGFLTFEKYNELNIVSLILFFSLLIVLLIIPFIDSGSEWNFDDTWRDILKETVVCEYQDGVYYYTSFNRLLFKSDNLISKWQLNNYVNIKSLNDILSMPEFSSKKDRREKMLKNLGL